MPFSATVRRSLTSSLMVAALLFGSESLSAQHGGQKGGGPRNAVPGLHMPAHPGKNQEHLAQWMDRHSNLPLDQQQKALESEHGFHDLPPETQQRMRDRLTQLNNMPPEQRHRVLERNEAMANLTVPQRQQIRGAMKQFSGLAPERRRLVAHAFRDLREMPVSQRQSVMSSDQFRSQFNDEERGTLSNLLAVEPYLPVSKPNEPSELGK